MGKDLQKLDEAIYGNYATVYHRTGFDFQEIANGLGRPKATEAQIIAEINAGKVTPDLLFKANGILGAWASAGKGWGFRAGSGDMYGFGFYSCYNEAMIHNNTGGNKGYGKLTLKFMVKNLHNYLIVDWDEFQKVGRYHQYKDTYTQDNYIYKQLVQAGMPIGDISTLESMCGAALNEKTVINVLGREHLAHICAPYFQGFIYAHGRNDGDVLVTFDLKKVRMANLNRDTYNHPYYRDAQDFADYKRTSGYMDLDTIKGYKKINSRVKRFLTDHQENIRTLIPLEWSIDDGKTWHKFIISPKVAKIIKELNDSYAYSNLVSNGIEGPISVEQFERYYYDKARNSIQIPYGLIQTKRLSIDLLNNFIDANNPWLVVDPNGTNGYFDVLSTIVNQFPKLKDRLIVSADMDTLVVTDRIKKIGKLQVPQPLKYLQVDDDINNLAYIVGNSTIDLMHIERAAYINANLTESLVDFRYDIKKAKVKMFDDDDYERASEVGALVASTLSAKDVIGVCDRKIKFHLTSKGLQIFKVNDKSLKAALKFSKYKYKLRITDSIKVLSDKDWDIMKTVTDSSVTVLDKLIATTASTSKTFLAQNNFGVKLLSIVGQPTVVGTGVTSCWHCVCDYTAWKAIRDHVDVSKRLIVFFKDIDDTLVITNEFIENFKRGNQKQTILLVPGSRGLERKFDVAPDLTKENLMWWLDRYDIYEPRLISSYLKNTEGIDSIVDDIDDEDKDIL